MKTKNILIVVIAATLLVIFFYSFQGSQDDAAYVERITRERKERDRFMLTSDESPIPDKEKFKGLQYFPADSKYRVIADLVPIENKSVVTLTTSDGKTERYIEYAYADFVLDGTKNRLLILEVIDMGPHRGKLFLAFGDETSANETYGAGRYLDLKKTPGSSTITLDFNEAYNPYCAYNETYSCPFPPQENLLKVAIRAGEKNYHD